MYNGCGHWKDIGVRKRISQRVGFLKPVGQEHITTPDGSIVDKDVRLFKDYFNLSVSSYGVMSPVVLPAGLFFLLSTFM